MPARFIVSELLGAAIASGVLIPLAVAHEGDWYPKGAPGFQGQQAYYYVPAIFAVAFNSVYQLARLGLVSSGRLRAGRRPKPLSFSLRRPLTLAEPEAIDTANALLGPSAAEPSLDRQASGQSGRSRAGAGMSMGDVPPAVWVPAWVAFSAAALVAFPWLFGCRVAIRARGANG